MFFLRTRGRKLIQFVVLTGALLITVLGIATSGGAASAHNAHQGDKEQTTAILLHTPTGFADVKWSAKSKNLTVAIKLTGLAQNSTHPAHIHLGVCTSNGPVLYMLNNVVADAAGVGTSTTVVMGVMGGIPSHGWYINVHNGPGLAPAEQFIPIACGNIHNSSKERSVHVFLGATQAENQAVSGKAKLSLRDDTLTVSVMVHGLVPGSAHAEHIHVGSCTKQVPGNVIYMLQNLVADSNGNASATTVIPNVEHIPDHSWYVNVHRTTMLGTQTGFDPIACGNVKSA